MENLKNQTEKWILEAYEEKDTFICGAEVYTRDEMISAIDSIIEEVSFEKDIVDIADIKEYLSKPVSIIVPSCFKYSAEKRCVEFSVPPE